MFPGLATVHRSIHFSGTFFATWAKRIKLSGYRGICVTGPLKQNEADARKPPVGYKIQKNIIKTICPPGQDNISNVELDDLELRLSTGKMSFNLTWLRDSCHCNKCTHQYSRQRLFTAKNFRRDMFTISDVQLAPECQQKGQLFPSTIGDGEGFLNVRWADGHESLYSLNWLRYISKLYKSTKLQLNGSPTKVGFQFPEDDFYLPTREMDTKPIYWNVSEITQNLKTVSYHDLVDGFEFNDDTTFINANKIADMSRSRFDAVWTLSHQLVTYGLAKIVDVPKERNQVLRVARSLAYEHPTGYGTVFDVVVESSEEINLAYSSLEFDLHSDLTYREMSPGVQLLHCIRDSIQGGLSYFSDAHNAAKVLEQTNPDLFEVLLQFPATFVVRDPYRNIKFRRQKPVISLDSQGNLSDVYYSPFMLPPVGFKEDVKLFYLAFDRFTQILQSKENKVIAKIDPGVLFIFHNRRVLHGRSAYDATTSKRFLQGCYMDWDEIKCLHEKLNSHRYVDGKI